MARIMKNAYGQSIPTEDDLTDTELHDSLPYDTKDCTKAEAPIKKSRAPSQLNAVPTKDPSPLAVGDLKSKKKSQSPDKNKHTDNIPVIKISKTESSECITGKEGGKVDTQTTVQSKNIFQRWRASKSPVVEEPKKVVENKSPTWEEKRKVLTSQNKVSNVNEERKEAENLENEPDASSQITIEQVQSNKPKQEEENRSSTIQTESSSGYKE